MLVIKASFRLLLFTLLLFFLVNFIITVACNMFKTSEYTFLIIAGPLNAFLCFKCENAGKPIVFLVYHYVLFLIDSHIRNNLY